MTFPPPIRPNLVGDHLGSAGSALTMDKLDKKGRWTNVVIHSLATFFAMIPFSLAVDFQKTCILYSHCNGALNGGCEYCSVPLPSPQPSSCSYSTVSFVHLHQRSMFESFQMLYTEAPLLKNEVGMLAHVRHFLSSFILTFWIKIRALVFLGAPLSRNETRILKPKQKCNVYV